MAKITKAPEAVVLQANTQLMLETLQQGVRGIMAITSASATDVVLELWEHIRSGNQEASKETHRKLVFLDSAFSGDYPATAKYLANLRGIPMNTRRRAGSPMRQSSAKAMEVWFETFIG